MHDHHDHNPIFCILPPHILEALARSGNSEEREWALRMLAADSTVRSQRTTQSALQAAAPPVPPSLTPHKLRQIYTAGNTASLPGTLVRSEGQAATGDS